MSIKKLRKLSFVLVAVVAAALAVSLTSCGDDDDPSSSGSLVGFWLADRNSWSWIDDDVYQAWGVRFTGSNTVEIYSPNHWVQNKREGYWTNRIPGTTWYYQVKYNETYVVKGNLIYVSDGTVYIKSGSTLTRQGTGVSMTKQ